MDANGGKVEAGGTSSEHDSPHEQLQVSSRKLMDMLVARNDPEKPFCIVFNPLANNTLQAEQSQNDNRILLLTVPPSPDGFFLILTKYGFFEIGTSSKSSYGLHTVEAVIKGGLSKTNISLTADIANGTFSTVILDVHHAKEIAAFEIQNENNPITDETLPTKAFEAYKAAIEERQRYESALKPVKAMLEHLNQPQPPTNTGPDT